MSCSSNGGNFIVPQPLCRDLFAFDLDEFIGDRVVELDGLLFDVFVEVGFVSQFPSLQAVQTMYSNVLSSSGVTRKVWFPS